MAKKYLNPNARDDGRPSRGAGMPTDLHGVMFDPNTMHLALQGVRPQESGALGFHTLRAMARVTQPIMAIVRTRQNQIARFARLPRFDGDVGITLRTRDPEAKPTAADKKQMRRLEDMILRCGVGPDPNGAKRPGLDHWLRMSVADSLVLDAIATERRYDRRGNLFDWWAIDAATVRMAVPSYEGGQIVQSGQSMYGVTGQGYGGVPASPSDDIAFVQLINQVTYAEFTAAELAYWIRNPRTDLEANGYGYSELESLIEIVTGFLNAMQYNTRYFTHSSIPEGVLGVEGQYSQENLDDFRRHWNAMVSGVNNAWRIPILATKNGKGVSWTPIKTNNREMMYHEWIDFLVTVACAVYQIDREEIGFSAKGAGESNSLNDGGNDATLKHSQSKGLHPLLTRFETGINEDILPHLPDSEDFVFGFAGLDPDLEEQKLERATKRLTAGISKPNEERAKLDLPKVPAEELWGDAPVNNQAYQAWSLAQQAQMQADGMGDDEGEEDDQDPDAPPPRLPKVNPDGTEEDDEDDDPAGRSQDSQEPGNPSA